VAEFQHGLLRLDTSAIAMVLILTGLSIAGVWMRLGEDASRRVYASIGIGLLAAGGIFACTFLNATYDASEGRRNSFSEADERALRQIHAPLRIEAHLAPEDPRRLDLENHALAKLRRIMPKLQVQYVAATSIGLFEQTRAGYGEIWYQMDGRRMMSRVTTEEGVLETIYALAGVAPSTESDEAIFRGHPLAVTAAGAGYIFYGLWPGIAMLAAILIRRRLK
jgi:hypothetical protein